MVNILCITFPVEPSEMDLVNKLVGRSSGDRDMYVSYWFNDDIYEWQMEDVIGNWNEEEIVISSIHQLDQAKLLITLGLPRIEIIRILQEMLND